MPFAEDIIDITPMTLSPLMLCDRLLRLAECADSAGLRGSAEVLLAAASQVLEPRAVLRL